MSTLNLYETLSDISEHMVRAAEVGDWDRLGELERRVAGLRSGLALADAQTRLTESERERKVHLIKRILADDRKVRSYTEPWMDHVRRFLGDTAPGSNVRSSYSAAGY
ncbi:MAG: flagellar protein FliT [Sterolibacteriaceae bacterium]|jgi:flagellar protein FliT|nr:flagellar protein FliT [Candidatus Methylophosphatis haderslevensis]